MCVPSMMMIAHDDNCTASCLATQAGIYLGMLSSTITRSLPDRTTYFDWSRPYIRYTHVYQLVGFSFVLHSFMMSRDFFFVKIDVVFTDDCACARDDDHGLHMLLHDGTVRRVS